MNGHKFLRSGHLFLLMAVLSSWSLAQPQDGNTTSPTLEAASSPAKPPAQESVPTATTSWGTGFVVAPGYLLTAYHVVQKRNQIRIGPVGKTSGGLTRWLKAEIVKTDPTNDLALLKFNEVLPALKLNPSTSTPVGIEAFVIGYPQPRIQGASRKITAGIVNGYRSEGLSLPESGLLQISAEISHGNSGGPVIAPDGTVIGMVQRKISTAKVAEKMQDLLINVSYALRSSQMVNFLKSTDAAYQTQSINLDAILRPYQIFDMHQQSVLAVVGRTQPTETPPSEQERAKE